MNTQTILQSDFTTKIASKAVQGDKVLNSSLGANKVTNTYLPNPFDVSITKDANFPIIKFNFKVYIDANYVKANPNPAFNFMVNTANSKFCLEYDYPEETPDYVYEYTIIAEYSCKSLDVNDEVTLYLMDTDPITSSGKKATVQPST
jgi:hypothetical protein